MTHDASPRSLSPDEVDIEIARCLSIDNPTSFFLFAGAGSGKTRSVVTALQHVREEYGARLRLTGRQVGVVTYTNAACDEIVRRIDFDPVVYVATIHSFVWEMIKGFNDDIRSWLQDSLRSDIESLKEEQKRGRAGTKAAAERERSIESKSKRLKALPTVRRFVYSPTGVNRGRDSLNHAEVIKLGAYFLTERPLMQQLLVAHYPILLIDESQDTNRLLMEAFLGVQRANRKNFALGLFGDTMQRIYADGKPDLGRDLPSDWARPAKLINYRCPKRVVALINKIRDPVDGQHQEPRADASLGHARLFVYGTKADAPAAMEAAVRAKMADITSDPLWNRPDDVKTLILEHHMAAKRLGFEELFNPLYQVDGFRTSLMEGTLPATRFFSDVVLPLVDAKRRGDEFAVASIVRKNSPLLNSETLRAAAADQAQHLSLASDAVQSLVSLWDGDTNPTLSRVVESIACSGLLELPESLAPFAAPRRDSEGADNRDDDEDDDGGSLSALRDFLQAPVDQIRRYTAYVSRKTGFDTHQGVKGLEFHRVLVVMDDDEQRGFLFSYEKLFGAKSPSERDRENDQSGKETGLERTRRLLYVTCSRAEKSLALIARSARPDLVRQHAIAQGWFADSEVELLG